MTKTPRELKSYLNKVVGDKDIDIHNLTGPTIAILHVPLTLVPPI